MTPKLKGIVSVIIIIFILIYIVAKGIFGNKSLKENHVFGIGYVDNYSVGGRGSAGVIWIDFSINVKGKNYKSSSSYSTSEIKIELLQHLRKKTLPVLYYPPNPSISMLMAFPKDYKRKGYSFPDSLKWILPYLKDN